MGKENGFNEILSQGIELAEELSNELKKVNEATTEFGKLVELDDTQDELEEVLMRNQMLLVSIIKGATSLGFFDELYDYLQEKVGESVRNGGIDQDSFEYFIHLLMMTQIEQQLFDKQDATT